MSRWSVFLDPDGTRGLGLMVIVGAPTGVTYRNQCGGLRTDELEYEGYLVPCPSQDYENERNVEAELEDFFGRHFHNQGDTADSWSASQVDELAALVERTVFWTTPARGEDTRTRLALDRARLAECTEAWIPVLTAQGPGILTFNNSD